MAHDRPSKAGKIWREHGALLYIEAVADDVKPGKRTSFPQSVKLKDDETVVFAYIVFKSRAHRDRVNAKVMKDRAPRIAEAPGTSRILDRRIVSLTTRRSIRTLPLAEKGRLKFLYPTDESISLFMAT